MADETTATTSPVPAPPTDPAPIVAPEPSRGEKVYVATRSFRHPAIEGGEAVDGAGYALKPSAAKGLVEAGLLVERRGD